MADLNNSGGINSSINVLINHVADPSTNLIRNKTMGTNILAQNENNLEITPRPLKDITANGSNFKIKNSGNDVSGAISGATINNEKVIITLDRSVSGLPSSQSNVNVVFDHTLSSLKFSNTVADEGTKIYGFTKQFSFTPASSSSSAPTITSAAFNTEQTITYGVSIDTFVATPANGGTITYVSTKPDVATIDASTGVITIKKAGTFKVQAQEDGGSSIDSELITVSKKTLDVGMGNNAFRWTSRR